MDSSSASSDEEKKMEVDPALIPSDQSTSSTSKATGKTKRERELSPHLAGSRKKMLQDSNAQGPSQYVLGPTATVSGPSQTTRGASPNTLGSSATVKSTSPIARGSSLSPRGPSPNIQGPSQIVKSPSPTARGPSQSTLGPSLYTQGPSQASRTPSPTARGASQLSHGPSLTPLGPSGVNQGSSQVVRGSPEAIQVSSCAEPAESSQTISPPVQQTSSNEERSNTRNLPVPQPLPPGENAPSSVSSVPLSPHTNGSSSDQSSTEASDSSRGGLQIAGPAERLEDIHLENIERVEADEIQNLRLIGLVENDENGPFNTEE